MKRLRPIYHVLFAFLLTVACQPDTLTDLTAPAHPGPYPAEITEGTLQSAAAFPVGNIWAAGHPTWGGTKGTDLGGPNDDWSPGAFGALSTIVQKDLELPLEDDLLAMHFNSITPEVALKPHCISVSPDSIDFREADAMMAFAEANGLRVHGHVLLFEKSVPEWALAYEANGTWTEAQWEAWLEDYIHTVVGRYRGRIAAWDVVNEIALPFGGGINTDYFWYRTIGPDFLDKAFTWAAEADPDTKLFMNDFAIGFIPDKLDFIIRTANDLRARGIRVDGIGFQGHIVLPILMGDYGLCKRAYKKAADAGYLVHISELDIAVNVLGQTQVQSDLQHRIQRKRYNDIARAFLDGVPPAQRWGITLWNISDRNSFYNTVKIWFDLRLLGGDKDYPMLWDENYVEKPAFYGFRNGLAGVYESWLYPPIGDTGREAGSWSETENAEFTRHLDLERRAAMEIFGLPEGRVRELAVDAEKAIREESMDHGR